MSDTERDEMAEVIGVGMTTRQSPRQIAGVLVAVGFGDVTELRDNLRQANAMYAGVCVENVALAAQVAAITALLTQHWDWKAGRSLYAAVRRALVSTPAAEGADQ